MTESFPRQQARTRRFTLGVPRAFAVSPSGDRITFLRSKNGSDPLTCLWLFDVATGTERLIADPVRLSLAGEEDLPPEEKRRRERVREQAGGIVSYAVDAALRTAVFSLAGRVFAVDLVTDVAGGASGAGRGIGTDGGARTGEGAGTDEGTGTDGGTGTGRGIGTDGGARTGEGAGTDEGTGTDGGTGTGRGIGTDGGTGTGEGAG
ncbi:MAG: hypothetical protein ABSF03_12770, partial [Streptosporangiaceae bacterium]